MQNRVIWSYRYDAILGEISLVCATSTDTDGMTDVNA